MTFDYGIGQLANYENILLFTTNFLKAQVSWWSPFNQFKNRT